MKSITKMVFGIYAVVGIVTMVSQISSRLSTCSEVLGCGLSFSKGVVWSVIWPAYWAIQWNWLNF